MNLADAPTEWFTMEIYRVLATASGREIHISKLTNVLSFRCICPKCGASFTDELSLKLHCQQGHVLPTWNGDSTPGARDRRHVLGDDNTTEGRDSDSMESAELDGDGPMYIVMNEDVRDDDVDVDDGDNDSSWSESYKDSFRADNDTSEAGEDIFEAGGTVRSKDSKNRTSKAAVLTRKTANTHTDADGTDQNNVVVDTVAEKPYKCTDCARTYKHERSLEAHHRMNSANIVYKCDKCGKQLSSAACLKGHMKLHLREMPYQCTICDRGFKRPESLDNHIRKHKIESLIRKSQDRHQRLTTATSAKLVEEKSALGEKQYVCAVCGHAYSTKKQLNRHYRKHLGEEVHHCQVCGKRFLFPYQLKDHSRIHTGEKPFVCSICGLSLTKQCNLTIHMKRHNKEFRHSCQDCGKAFVTSFALKSHRWTHTGEKPYLCPTCGKGFTAHTRFKEHKMIHTGEKPYVCSMCGKAFNQRHCLKEHVVIHEDNPGIPCPFCGKSCSHRSALNAHIRTVHRKKSNGKLNIESFLNI